MESNRLGGWKVILSRQAAKDARKLAGASLRRKAEELLAVLEKDPYQNPPRYEKLAGELRGYYSRRINQQHRLVYAVDESRRVVHVLRMWTHYE